MAAAERDHERAVLIDFASGARTPYVSYAARLPLGGVTLSRCIFPPNPGTPLGSTQLMVAVHSSAAFELEWRDPDSGELRHQIINPDQTHIVPAALPVFHRWAPTTRALVIALDRQFVAHTFAAAFERDPEVLPVVIGTLDPTIRYLAALCDREITEGGAAGRFYAEALATALTIHLFRRHGTKRPPPLVVKGGLAPIRLRRVTDYIHDHLADDISLGQMAGLAGLSPYHFAHVFKVMTGVSPHHFVIDQRIARARALLDSRDRSIAEVALAVGFSSQSHFTLQFHRLTGTTPARFRRYH